jgi:methionyl-tRNA formyltransferase
MKQMSKPIVFFGNERIATGVKTTAPTLQKLLRAGYQVATVVANNESTVSRNRRELEIASVARAHGVPLMLPKRLRDIKDELARYEARVGVLVAYGKIIPQDIIDLFPHGIINIHPSLLPLHRGPTPIESAILQGDNKTGVSIMQLVKDMDAGPVYTQRELPLTGAEAKQELADTLLRMGGDALLEALPDILNNALRPVAQNDSKATYDRLISKKDAPIDWSKSAIQIEREIRAFAGWPQSRATIGGLTVAITKAHVIHESGPPGQPSVKGKSLRIYCGEHALEIERLKPAGKQEMDVPGFLAGYKSLIVTP